MSRRHTLAVALVLTASAVAAMLALTSTVHLGQASGGSTTATKLAARTAQLDRFEASLRRQLAEKPPALPPAPRTASPAPASAGRVVYVRPAPIVVHKHRTGGEFDEEGGEHGGGESGDD